MSKIITFIILVNVFPCTLSAQKNSQVVKSNTRLPHQLSSKDKKSISVEDKVLGLSKFWKDASYNFAYFENIKGLDFDSLYRAYLPMVMASKNEYEYYRLLQKFCSILNDGHTTVFFPPYIKNKLITPSVLIRRIGERIYITNVGLPFKGKIQPGSEILKVNGKHVLVFLNREVYPYMGGCKHVINNNGAEKMLTGLSGTSISLAIRSPDGKLEEIKIERSDKKEEWAFPLINITPEQESIIYKDLSESIGYLKISSFWYGRDTIYSYFKKMLPVISRKSGLVLDVRQNTGGLGTIAMQIARHFTDKPYFLSSLGSTRKHLPSHKAWGAYADSSSFTAKLIRYIPGYERYLNFYKDDEWEYEKIDTIFIEAGTEKLLMPIVILTDYKTGSSTEDLLIALESVNRGIRIGQNTSGSTGQQLYAELPGGGYYQICTRRCTYPDGRKFIGVGIKPQIEIEPTLEFYLKGTDVVLQRAINYLKEDIISQHQD